MNHRIIYLREKGQTVYKNGKEVILKGQPVACVATNFNANFSKITYQLSVLNPCDQFNRKMARHLALGRLVESPIDISGQQAINTHEITLLVMKDIASRTGDVPSRAVKAARRWCKSNIQTSKVNAHVCQFHNDIPQF